MFDLFQWMDANVADAFTAALRRRRYTAGQMIYSQGDAGLEMYRIVEGSVRMSITRSDGREVTLILFEPGDCFGDSSLVDGEPRPQTTQAQTNVVLDSISKARLDQLRQEFRSLDSALLKLLARQMRVVSEQFTTSNLDDLPARVAGRIVNAMRSFGTEVEQGIRLSMRLSQSEIATMVGASRQSVNRVLQRFQTDGLVTIEYGNLLIRDPAGLERVAGLE
ncbi:Crp/Fnr family transcriptional regulator [Sphingomonas bisphenolicum]